MVRCTRATPTSCSSAANDRLTDCSERPSWCAANTSLAQQKLGAFWLDIRIADGTNTREEKAAFIAATFAKMNELIGPLHSASYVHVNEVRGDAYGYGGVTQTNATLPAN